MLRRAGRGHLGPDTEESWEGSTLSPRKGHNGLPGAAKQAAASPEPVGQAHRAPSRMLPPQPREGRVTIITPLS